MIRDYYVYACGPIDWWAGWGKVDPFITYVESGLGIPPDEMGGEDMDASMLESFRVGLAEAKRLAKRFGWEGDGEWRFSPLPDPECCETAYMYAVKQNNNGSVWVVSPYPLVWLDGDGVYP